ncbi:MAG: hypothetical protein ACPGNP_12880 [Acidimicrobiales bacterium]
MQLVPKTSCSALAVDGQSRKSLSVAGLILVLLVKPTGLFGERLSAEDRA